MKLRINIDRIVLADDVDTESAPGFTAGLQAALTQSLTQSATGMLASAAPVPPARSVPCETMNCAPRDSANLGTAVGQALSNQILGGSR